jgi:hypothetical protein
MVLVDTSVWISHFREGNKKLIELLEDGRVMCHPYYNLENLPVGTLKIEN